MKMKIKGYILVILTVLELSLLPVFTGLGILNISVLQFLFYTFLVGTATSFLALIAAKRLRGLFGILSNKRALGTLIIAGMLNYAVAQLLIAIAIKGTNPIVVSLITKLWPIIIAIMLPFTLKIRMAKGQLLALLLGFVGVYILATHGSIAPRLFGAAFIGIAVLSTFATAGSNIMIRSQNQDVFSQVFIFNASSLIFIALIVSLLNVQFEPIDSYIIISFLFIGAISYSLGALMFFYTLKMFDPLLIANSTYATPILTMIFSYIMLGTPFYPYYLISFAFIILALAIQQRYAKRAPRYSPRERKQGVHIPLFDISGAFINTKSAEIANAIGNSGRALGAKIKTTTSQSFNEIDPNKYGCIIFTANNHKGYASPEELEFIKDIVGAEKDEDVLVCVGRPDEAEKAIYEYITKFTDFESPVPGILNGHGDEKVEKII
ncbi:MAG: EamA family transporter [Candidatus Micrarchaeia archaeon]|jgi:drug/metabolite transporter (DMT)-like permease